MISRNPDYLLCGWHVRSQLALPDLVEWIGPDGPPDIHIEFGAVPQHLPDAEQVALWLHIAKDGTSLLTVPNVARYLVSCGNRVVIDANPEIRSTEITVFLLGTVLGLLTYQRGLLPLHASAVRMGEGAVLIAGASGVGKSTLASGLVSRGHGFIADDVSVIKGGSVCPSFPRSKLWQDSLLHLGMEAAGLVVNRPGQLKFHVPHDRQKAFDPIAVPVRAIFATHPPNGAKQATLVRMVGAQAVTTVLNQLYRPRAAHALSRDRDLFEGALRLAAEVPVYVFHRAVGELEGLEDNLNLIERTVLG